MGVFRVTKIKEFCAAHFLPDYAGKCHNLHGHTWKMGLTLISRQVDKDGIAIDFSEVSKFLEELRLRWDHRCLNDFFAQPTAESVAVSIAKEASQRFPGQVFSATVWESENSILEYLVDG